MKHCPPDCFHEKLDFHVKHILTYVNLFFTFQTMEFGMIVSFRHKGLEQFFKTGSTAGIRPHHAPRLRIQLTALNSATALRDVDAPGWRLHPLHGELQGHWAISVNGNWRLSFRFLDGDVEMLDYIDYH